MAINGKAFWDQFNTGYDTGKKIWQADSDRRRDAELAKASGLNQTVDRQDNDMVVAAAQGLQPGETMGWDAESQSYTTPTGEKYAAKLPQYSLGGVTRGIEFSQDEIGAARRRAMGDVYGKYGQVDKADELALRGMQMKSTGLQIKKMEGDMAAEDEFQAKLKGIYGAAEGYGTVAKQAQALLANGDSVGAAKLISDWRSNNVPDARMMRVNEQTGMMEGSEDGGKTWMAGSGVNANAHNPSTVQMMLGEMKGTLDDQVRNLSKQYAKSPTEIMNILNSEWDRSFKERDFTHRVGVDQRNFDYGVGRDQVKDGQWGATHGLAQNVQQETSRHNRATEGIQASEAAANNSYRNAVGQYYQSGRNITYDNAGNAYVPTQGANGSIVMQPVVTSGGQPFVGSPKSVGTSKTADVRSALLKQLETGAIDVAGYQSQIAQLDRLDAYAGLGPDQGPPPKQTGGIMGRLVQGGVSVGAPTVADPNDADTYAVQPPQQRVILPRNSARMN